MSGELRDVVLAELRRDLAQQSAFAGMYLADQQLADIQAAADRLEADGDPDDVPF